MKTLIRLAAMVTLCCGCGADDGPPMTRIRGEVTYNDQPLAGGQVVYLPKESGVGRQAFGPLDEDGAFVMTTREEGDGVQHGEYDIVIYAYDTNQPAASGDGSSRKQMEEAASTPKLPKSKVPARYAIPGGSGLSDKVDASHSGFKRIDLSD